MATRAGNPMAGTNEQAAKDKKKNPDVSTSAWLAPARHGGTVTCHSVTLVFLTTWYLEPPPGHPLEQSGQRQRLGACLMKLLEEPSGITEMSYPALCNVLAQYVSPSVIAELTEHLSEFTSVDALWTLFSEVNVSRAEKSVANYDCVLPVRPESTLGLFLRRQLLHVRNGSFSALADLATAMPSYLQATAPDNPPPGNLTNSPHLAQFLHHMAKDIAAGRETSESNLKALEDLAISSPKAEYIRYLHHLREQDLTLAIDSLHKYFDLPVSGAALPGDNGDNTDHGFARYGALNLAAVHYRFGHMNAALCAIDETIKIAQRYSDKSTLAHALAWLFRIVAHDTDHGSGPSAAATTRLMKRCAAKSEQLGLHHIAALSHLALASESLTSGTSGSVSAAAAASRNDGSGVTGDSDNAQPVIWTRMARVVTLLAAEQATTQSPTPGVQDLNDNIRHASELLRAAAWDVLGSSGLARLSSRIIMRLQGSCTGRDELAFAVCRLGMSCLDEGNIRGAADILKQAESSLGSPWHPLWYRTVLLVRLRFAVDACKLPEALVLAQRLLCICPRSVDVQLHCKALYQYLQVLIKSKHYDVAARVALSLRETATTHDSAHEIGAYNLALAEIHLASGSATSALPFALEALSYTSTTIERKQLLAAKLVIALIQEALGNIEEASSQLLALLPDILADGGQRLTARCSRALGRVLLHQVPPRRRPGALAPVPMSDDDVQEWHHKMTEAIHELERARVSFGRLYDLDGLLETTYLLSRAYRECGRTEASDEAAQAFLDFSQKRDLNLTTRPHLDEDYCSPELNIDVPVTR